MEYESLGGWKTVSQLEIPKSPQYFDFSWIIKASKVIIDMTYLNIGVEVEFNI